MIGQYKAHVLAFVEYRTPAIYHASTTALAPLDAVQRWFLRELGLSEVEALEHFKLAPLTTRRDLAMHGVLRRAVLGRGPSWLASLLGVGRRRPIRRVGLRSREHRRAIPFARGLLDLEICKRSLLGVPGVYNILPEEVTEASSVAAFQSRAQAVVLKQARAGHVSWETLLSPCHALYRHPLLNVV